MSTYTLTLDNSPKAALFVEMLKEIAFVKKIEPAKKVKKEKIDFENIDTTELLMKDKKLMKTIADHKAGKLKFVTFTGDEFEKYSKELLKKTK